MLWQIQVLERVLFLLFHVMQKMIINCQEYYSHLQRRSARSCPLLYGTLLSGLPHAVEGAMGYCSSPTESSLCLLWTRRYEIGGFHSLKILLAASVPKSKMLRTSEEGFVRPSCIIKKSCPCLALCLRLVGNRAPSPFFNTLSATAVLNTPQYLHPASLLPFC